MKLYLIRHADAVPEDVAGSDHERWLSLRGREAARGLARLLRDQGVELDAVATSPLPRAVQTAELVAAGLDYLGAVTVVPSLAPGCHPRRAAELLATLGGAVAVVGHEPGISGLGAYVLGRPAFPPMRTAQCCALDRGAPTFTARADLMQVSALFLDG
ncbi:MAG TPA: histidine phosphatase family protein [Kofleriaceae bacterium]|nr:histidine phosphatase family protein [Kofleriaceae bacterium]